MGKVADEAAPFVTAELFLFYGLSWWDDLWQD